MALGIIALSTLPYFHEFITNSGGTKSWVPDFGVEPLLTQANGKVWGFSSYRVLLYTVLIFIFAAIGWAGWYQTSRKKGYNGAVLLTAISGAYHVLLIVLDLRKTVWNDSSIKIAVLAALFSILFLRSPAGNGRKLRKFFAWVLLFVISALPFLHDLITENGTGTRGWVPNLGIEAFLTDGNGHVRGLGSYRILLYLFCIYLFSHLGWIGWFMDSRGRRIRPFLLVPSTLSLYQVVVILMSWRETEFNSPSANLYITLAVSLLLAINFFFNNRFVPNGGTALNGTATIKPNDNENR